VTSPTATASSPRVRKDIRNAAIISIAVVAVIAAAYFFWPQRPRPLTPHERTITAMMISDLRALVTQEAIYFKFKGQFTDNPDNTYFMRSPGVSRPDITVKGSGWYATVTHDGLPNVTCAVAVGVRNPLNRWAKETEAVCR
jgi:hypothetical protein